MGAFNSVKLVEWITETNLMTREEHLASSEKRFAWVRFGFRFSLWWTEIVDSCPWGQKTQPGNKHLAYVVFNRLPSCNLGRADVPSTSAMFPQSFSPDQRQAAIAHRIGHAALHFCCTPMIVSNLPNSRDTDEIHSVTVGVHADRSCRLD